MKKIRKIIISFGIVLMGFAKKVLADIPDIKDHSSSLYGVTTPVLPMVVIEFLEYFLTFFLIPIVFFVGLANKKHFEKKIDLIDSTVLKLEREKAKRTYKILVTTLFIVFIIILGVFSFRSFLVSEMSEVKDNISIDYRFTEKPGYYFAGIILLCVVIVMTYNNVSIETKKIMCWVSAFAIIISFIVFFIISSYFDNTTHIIDGGIIILENMLLAKQIYQYKIKLINEKN